VTGVVVENATGRPLSRTRVSLQARNVEVPTGRGGLLSGSGGEFSFSELPAGIYFLRAERDGFASARFGQTEIDGPGTPIVLDANSHFGAELRLKRLGVITGAVLDENQVGLEGITVRAYRMVKAWKAVVSGSTDDRGVYRLSGLKPGRYLVRTGPKRLDGKLDLLPTYYGQGASASEAQVLDVKPDQEITAADIRPAPGRLGLLSGRLLGASAREVQLMTDTGPRRQSIRPGGRFALGQLEPGAYTLLVDPGATGGALAGMREVIMGDVDQEVEVEMKPAPRLTVRCEAAATDGFDPKGVSIFLRRKNLDVSATRVRCGLSSVWSPGDWEIGVAPLANYYTVAILEASEGDEAHEFRVVPGEEKQIKILLSDRPGGIRGVVELNGDPVVGAPVFLSAYDPELLSRAGGIRETRADEKGRYEFLGLPPGRYEAVSSYQIKDPLDSPWQLGIGTAVTVNETEQIEQDLSLTEIQ
jgi:hypothetical protein